MKGVTVRPVALVAVMMASISSVHAATAESPDLSSFIGAQGGAAQQDVDKVTTERVSRYGQIVSSRPVGLGGLTAWTVQKNGHQVVLFSTPDSAVLFSGVAWNAATGQNISDAFLPGAVQAAAQAPQMSPAQPSRNVRQAAAMDGNYKGEITESMKTVDSLAGIKEGNGSIGNTVYIVMDPRCPYCRQAYNLSRAYVEKGASIKWIPSAALGNPADGVPLAATLLQSRNREVLDRVMGKHEQIRSKPTEQTVEQLSRNLAFLLAAFKNNGRGEAGVPAAFFIDHRTGKPKMLTGLSEASVLEDIFGPL